MFKQEGTGSRDETEEEAARLSERKKPAWGGEQAKMPQQPYCGGSIALLAIRGVGRRRSISRRKHLSAHILVKFGLETVIAVPGSRDWWDTLGSRRKGTMGN